MTSRILSVRILSVVMRGANGDMLSRGPWIAFRHLAEDGSRPIFACSSAAS